MTTSCEDFLTTDNKSNVTDKEYFSTKTGFESLVSNAYSTLRDVYAVSSYTTYFNAGTDMYADGRNYINDELHEYETLNPENSVMKELYTACYKGIRAAYAIKHYAAMQLLMRICVAGVWMRHEYWRRIITIYW